MYLVFIPSTPKFKPLIRKFPLLTTLTKIREFLGQVNVYRRFIHQCSQIIDLLTDMFRPTGSTQKSCNTSLERSEPVTTAFDKIKVTLALSTLLFHPRPDAQLCLMTDGSDVAVGAVLQLNVSHPPKPATVHLDVSYSQCIFRCAIFDTIERRQFFVWTDHKPLTYALHKSITFHSPREIRHLDFISQFTTDIRHVNLKENTVADALSRISNKTCFQNHPITSSTNTITYDSSTCKPRPSSLWHFDSLFSNLFITFLTLVSRQPNVLSPSGMLDQHQSRCTTFRHCI